MSYDRYRDPKKQAAGRPTPPPKVPSGSQPAQPRSPQQPAPATTDPPTPPRRSHDSDEYTLQTPQEYALREELVAAPIPISVPPVRQPVITQDPLPDPPSLPFWTGVFSFPFYLQSLGVWMLIAFGLTVGALGLVLCIWCLDQGLTLAFRCFVIPVFLIIAFTCSYASAACMAIIETTADGYDHVDNWPTGDWREWVWTLAYPGTAIVLSLLLGWATNAILPLHPPIPAVAVVFVSFPIFLLSALEAGSPIIPVSMPVLDSLVVAWWGWAMFYVEAGAMLVIWWTLIFTTQLESLWLTAVVAAPVLAAGLMIYSRLLGRLAWYIDHRMSRARDDEDD